MFCISDAMAKTKAEIQKAYRERKKQREGENYLAKERARVKGYYVPIEDRPTRQANNRRQKVRAWVEKHRELKKAQKSDEIDNRLDSGADNQLQDMEVISSTTTQDMEVSSSTNASTSSLIVKLPHLIPQNRTRSRVTRATSKLRRDVKRLTKEKENANRRFIKVSKRYQRLVNKSKSEIQQRNEMADNPSTSKINNCTPRKRTLVEMREEGLTPRKVPNNIQNKLLLANVLTEEIGSAWNSSRLKGKSLVSKMVSGATMKKYRMKKVLSLTTGIRRQNFKG